MKYLCIGLLILALLLAGGLLDAGQVEARTEAVAGLLEQALTALRAEDEAGCRALLAQAGEEWAQQEALLSSLLSHDRTGGIGADFAEAAAMPADELERCCLRLLRAVRELAASERTSFKNIW